MKVKIRSHTVDLEVLDRPQPPSDSNRSVVKDVMGVAMGEAPSEN